MKLKKVSKYIILLLLIPSIYVFINPGKSVVISIICTFPLIGVSVLFLPKFLKLKFEGKHYVYLFLLLNFIILFRGFLDAKSDQDWKVLLSMMLPICVLFPISIFLGLKNNIILILFSSFLKYGLLLSVILLFGNELGMMGFPHNTSPIYLFILFLPYVKVKWRIFILAVVLVSFFSDLGMRSNMLNIIIALLIYSTYYLKRINFNLTLSLVKILRRIILIAPIIFIVLALSGTFNIFKIGEFIGEQNIEIGDGDKQDVVVDSRTGIYTDVILELYKQKAFLWGLGGSGKTDTYLTELAWGDFAKTYKEGRRATESSMLNFAQWGGAIGVIIYLLLFAKASFLAIYKSKNWLSIMIGIWVVYKAIFSFIEDRVYVNLNSLFIMISIGMCFNEVLREMSDAEIKAFIRSIFERNKIVKEINID